MPQCHIIRLFRMVPIFSRHYFHLLSFSDNRFHMSLSYFIFINTDIGRLHAFFRFSPLLLLLFHRHIIFSRFPPPYHFHYEYCHYISLSSHDMLSDNIMSWCRRRRCFRRHYAACRHYITPPSWYFQRYSSHAFIYSAALCRHYAPHMFCRLFIFSFCFGHAVVSLHFPYFHYFLRILLTDDIYRCCISIYASFQNAADIIFNIFHIAEEIRRLILRNISTRFDSLLRFLLHFFFYIIISSRHSSRLTLLNIFSPSSTCCRHIHYRFFQSILKFDFSAFPSLHIESSSLQEDTLPRVEYHFPRSPADTRFIYYKSHAALLCFEMSLCRYWLLPW